MPIQNKKVKIFYLITKASWGGAQRYVYNLATGLDPLQFDVTVLAGEGDDLFLSLKEKNIATIRLSGLGRDVRALNDLRSFFELVSIFRKEKPDIIHANSSKMGLLSALAGRVAGIKKIIFTAHGWAFNENRSFLSIKGFLFLQWLTVILSHTTIAVSQKTLEDMAKMPFARNKITLIYNGILSPEFKEKTGARLALNPSIKEKFWIGTIAELHKNKGVDYLIQGFAKFVEDNPDSALVIISDGEEKLTLQNLAKERKIENKVYFLGRIPKAEIYIKAFDIFALTSRTEALPYTILEAGFSGVPIVASYVGGIPEIITSLKTGILVRPGNIKGIYLALTQLAKNKEMANEYARALALKIEKDFSFPKMLKKTVALYR